MAKNERWQRPELPRGGPTGHHWYSCRDWLERDHPAGIQPRCPGCVVKACTATGTCAVNAYLSTGTVMGEHTWPDGAATRGIINRDGRGTVSNGCAHLAEDPADFTIGHRRPLVITDRACSKLGATAHRYGSQVEPKRVDGPKIPAGTIDPDDFGGLCACPSDLEHVSFHVPPTLCEQETSCRYSQLPNGA